MEFTTYSHDFYVPALRPAALISGGVGTLDGLICCHQSAWLTFPAMRCHAKILRIMFWETPGAFLGHRRIHSNNNCDYGKG